MGFAVTDLRVEVARLRTELRQIKTTQLRADVGTNTADIATNTADIATNTGAIAGITEVPTGTLLAYATGTAPTGFLNCDGAAVSETTFADLFALIGYTYGNPGGGNFNLPDMRGRMPIGVGTLAPDTYTLAGTGGTPTHVLTEAELAAHDHTVGTLVNGNQSASHDHNAGQLASNNQSASHRHTLPNHVHTISHDHTALSEVSDASVGGASQRVRSTGSGLSVGSPTNANSGNPTSLPTGGLQNASHSHTITGDTANQNTSHAHTITGSVANAGSGTAHENRPPYLTVNYVIKT